MHLFYRVTAGHPGGRRLWRGTLALLYALAGFLAVQSFLDFGAAMANPLRAVLAGAASLGSAALLCFSPLPPDDAIERRHRRWLTGLCLAWAALGAASHAADPRVPLLLLDAVPLCFLFAITYYVERLTCFDILIKRGAFAFTSLLVLTLYFAIAPPALWWANSFVRNTPFGVMIWAGSLLPVVLLAPWTYQRLSRWLDRMLLGRRFPAAGAAEYFLKGLQGAIDVNELVHRAERRLEEIFRSESRVLMEPPETLPRDSIQAPVRIRDQAVGALVVGGQQHRRRFLSEDLALLSSLAEAFSFLLENLQLRERRLEQEQRERELLANAQRAELKALRAQVNPHFLFNALNTIAGLVRVDPDRAERTIEQLADVFRFTLRRSDREWVRVEDEIEAVRAYLAIEQTRFRERLAVRLQCADSVRNWRVPAMMLQTLAENAIKHGVDATAQPGAVEIDVRPAGAGLRIEVRDTGPGFPEAAPRSRPAPGSGFGLRNVRERLQGHFGSAAHLEIGRDPLRAMTVVSVHLPPEAAARNAPAEEVAS
jgi:signal transduction histidine kinase